MKTNRRFGGVLQLKILEKTGDVRVQKVWKQLIPFLYPWTEYD
jgi:hypothetical protein